MDRFAVITRQPYDNEVKYKKITAIVRVVLQLLSLQDVTLTAVSLLRVVITAVVQMT